MNTLNLSQMPAVRSRAGGLQMLFLLGGLLATVSHLRADNPPTYLFQIPTSADYVALDGSNNVYITGAANGIATCAGNGTNLTQWTNSISGNFVGIAIDASNNVYVCDDANAQIDKFTANGTLVGQWGTFGNGNEQFENPQGIAVDSAGNVYVADFGNDRIQKFTSSGAYLTQWGSFGSDNGQFYSPEGIAVDSSGNVYVSDSGNQRVEKFTSNGSYLSQWSTDIFNGESGLEPTGIAVSKSGDVYVAILDDLVEKFTSDGAFLTQWSEVGSLVSFNLEGIAVDSTGNFIYVADYYNNWIQVFANNAAIIPPFITTQPFSQNVPAGVNVTFSPVLVGGLPFGYQWSSNSIPLPGATNATLTLSNVSLADSASYSILVTNRYGSISSSDAVLLVLPSLTVTEPASGISASGAVLNGSVTVGPDDTTTLFEWGTDTNYGNIAGTILLPGNSGTNQFSAALSGLPGNIYHYRVDASNAFGVVYGSDELFRVGLAPAVSAFFATTTTNSATLNVAVNPNGWDTKVYFNYAGHTTPTDIGSGSTATNVQLAITGLTLGTFYNVQGFASNAVGLVSSTFTFQALPWNFTAAPPQPWQTVSSSADGSKLAAATYGGGIFTSTNAGITWSNQSRAPFGDWIGIASSADGNKLVAAMGGFFGYQSPGPIFTSTNAGATWRQQTNAPVWHWDGVASSADGTQLAAVANGGGVGLSTNSGITWSTNSVPALAADSLSIASSADGSKLVVAVNQGLVYSSTNAGSTWTTNNVPATNWQTVGSSADGNKLVVAAGGYSPSVGPGTPGPIYTSTNAGANWTEQTNTPIKDWFSVASSADGNKLVAVAYGNFPGFTNSIYTSPDAGVTWNVSDAVATSWQCVVSSADGSRLIAVANQNLGGVGRIYTLPTTPSPMLNLTASGNGAAVSWIIPSQNFTLQQSPDLSSWTEVTNPPVLDLTNLQNQVALPPSGADNFFRLIH